MWVATKEYPKHGCAKGTCTICWERVALKAVAVPKAVLNVKTAEVPADIAAIMDAVMAPMLSNPKRFVYRSLSYKMVPDYVAPNAEPAQSFSAEDLLEAAIANTVPQRVEATPQRLAESISLEEIGIFLQVLVPVNAGH